MASPADMLQLMTELEKSIAQEDTKAIFDLIELLFQNGHRVSAADVALLYELGEKPVGFSLKQAYEWYARGAYEEDDKIGYVGLGRFYLDGRYVEQDSNKARQLFEKAAALGSIESHVLLGYSYLGANGASQNLTLAEKYLLPAASKGYVAAFFLLARVASARRNYLSMFRYIIKSVYWGYLLPSKNKSDPRLYLTDNLWGKYL